jgi:hypothetical protein
MKVTFWVLATLSLISIECLLMVDIIMIGYVVAGYITPVSLLSPMPMIILLLPLFMTAGVIYQIRTRSNFVNSLSGFTATGGGARALLLSLLMFCGTLFVGSNIYATFTPDSYTMPERSF